MTEEIRRLPIRLLRARSLHLLVGVALGGWAIAGGLEAAGGLAEIRADYGLAASVVLIPAHAILAVSPFPSEVFAIAYAAIYGFVPGCLFAWAGWMLGALLEYALFRRAARDLDEQGLAARLPAWLREFPASHPVFLIAGRWVPFGNHVVNAVAGAHRVPTWRFLWASAIALIPAAVLVAAAATGFGVLHD